MKERFIKLLDSVGYPYRSINSVDKKELVEIHKEIFNKSSSYYSNRTCSSCYVSMREQLRALDAGIKIGITYVENVPISVDTVEDLMLIENILNSTDENK